MEGVRPVAEGGLSRRRFLQHSSVATAVGLLGQSPMASRFAHLRGANDNAPRMIEQGAFVDPSLIHQFAMRAIDAAKSAGATYADVRLTRTLQQAAGGGLGLHFTDEEVLGVGVRALVKGAWGFAATSYWTEDEVVRVAQAAVAQAKVNAIGVTQPIELVPIPVATGSWVTPVTYDPFLMPWELKLNVIEGTTEAARHLLPPRALNGGVPMIPYPLGINCYRQERALATTDGTYVTQTVYRTGGSLFLQVDDGRGTIVSSTGATGLEMTGRGWELFADAHLVDQIPRMLEEAEHDAMLPAKPVEVGQYDVVCDGNSVASLVDATFGAATELDRALGYEANAGGTSYLGPNPSQWLGTAVASPLVNITANRSVLHGLATVKWDDDGVVPSDFPLITAGQLVDYQTTRDQAPHLRTWYGSHQQAVHSHGCAASEDAQTVSLSMIPNLALTPSASGPTVDEMIADMGKGIAMIGSTAATDFQAKNGTLSYGSAYEVKGGKKVARLAHAAILFSSTEFWKNVTTVGGPGSVAQTAQNETKGQPDQSTVHTVSGVALTLTKQALIDDTRKA
jgi:TldD protein